MNPSLSRRRFLQASAATAGAAWSPPACWARSRARRTRSSSSSGRPRPPTTRSSPSPSRAARSAPKSSATSSSCGSGHPTRMLRLQADLLDAAITAGCDGMGISCNDATVLLPIIDRATAAGIPVITWDSDSPDSTRLSFYSFDDDVGRHGRRRALRRGDAGQPHQDLRPALRQCRGTQPRGPHRGRPGRAADAGQRPRVRHHPVLQRRPDAGRRRSSRTSSRPCRTWAASS